MVSFERVVILLSFFSLLVGVWSLAYAAVTYVPPQDFVDSLADYRSLCSDPLFVPAYSHGLFYAVRSGLVNVSLSERVVVLSSCRSLVTGVVFFSENIK